MERKKPQPVEIDPATLRELEAELKRYNAELATIPEDDASALRAACERYNERITAILRNLHKPALLMAALQLAME